MRAIDADHLKRWILSRVFRTQLNVSDVIDQIDREDTIEPEIVRCKDCKHRDPEDHKCDCGHDIIWQLPRDDKWYCADAERKDGEADG